MDIEEARRIYMHLDPAKQFISGIDTDFFFNFAYVVLSELDKKDKIINAMARELYKSTGSCLYEGVEPNYKDIIDYFTKKVEKDENNN